ncbi:hypothetical protein RN001_013694 [Aquatica leii]|uniref:Uncharacterized protein n=1 Tax=Aquatica leii TaxID=1421715 RepID=A0AAN7SE22_9COLE|nr:hypothetical protein RN001_013694 [Aquatica leii]
MPRSIVQRKVNKASKAQRNRWARAKILQHIEESDVYVAEDFHVKYFECVPEEHFPELDVERVTAPVETNMTGNRIVNISFSF